MTNFPSTWSPKDLRDLDSINYWKEMKALYPHDKEMLARAWTGIVRTSRDNARTPVQWSSAPHAGFSPPDAKTKPWIRVNDNYKQINVATQLDDPTSVLSFWKKMLKIRKRYGGLLVSGHYEVHDYENLKTFTFVKRTGEGRVALVVLNFSEEGQVVQVPRELEGLRLRVLVGNGEGGEEGVVDGGVEGDGKWKLGPWEGRVYVEKDDAGDVLVAEDGREVEREEEEAERGFVFV